MNNKKITFFELISLIIIFFIFLIFLSPSGFGENISAETWKSWAASRILLTEGKFVQNSLGPLYYIFLTILSPFDYKNSIIIEYFITHIFFLICIYILFRNFNKKILGILFSIFIITYISFIESPKYILASGFMILHFANYKKNYFYNWFPPFLLISILCNWGYIVFYLGHLFGKTFFHLKHKNFYITKPNLLTIFLCSVLLCPIIFKADKFYNNHYVDYYDPNYAPIVLDSPFKIGFFQFGNWKYSKKTYSYNDQYKADWYITHKNYYGECKTFGCVLKNNPKIVVEELSNDLGYNLRILTSMILNKDILIIKKIYFIFFLFLFGLIILLGSFNILKRNNGNYILIFSLLFGTAGYILALSLTTFSYRYCFPLYPVIILLLLNADFKIPKINKKYFKINLILVFVILIQFIFNIKDYSINFNNKEFYKIGHSKITEKRKVDYFKSANDVFSLINNKQKILTTDSNWLSGFSQAIPKQVYSIFALPPVANKNTQNFLDSFDIILLNYNIQIEQPSVGTQTYLRYELHLKEYLANNKDKWVNKQIENFGNIYIKKD